MALVAAAKARGHDATHVTWIGKAGLQDWNLIPIIAENRFLFATTNRRDFLRLYAELENHSGLIVILPSADRSAQIELFGFALDATKRLQHTTNALLEVHHDGRVDVRSWGKGDHDPEHINGPR